MRWIAMVVSAAATVLAQDQSSNDALEKAKSLTVMINATIDGDTRPGAGIVFGVSNGQIYIATANHLVRRGTSNASEIRVEFRWLPGQPLPAKLLTDYDDRALDLAVLAVEGAKAHADKASLPAQPFGDPAALTHAAAVSAIGYPDGTAWDTGSAEVSQIEAVLVKYHVAGLAPGGYSGGPLVDRNGMIVGMIRQDQPPNGEATRIDLVVSQLKAWNYDVGSASAGRPEQSFRDALLRYVAEVPQGFRALGAKPLGNWTPSVILPDAIDCRGGGSAREPFIECVFYQTSSESDAEDQFENMIDIVHAALPEWKYERLNLYNSFFRNGPAAEQSTVVVNLGVRKRDENYEVTLMVLR